MPQADTPLRILVAAGGTVGHVGPSLVTAEELAARGHEIAWIGSVGRAEEELVPAAGFALTTMPVTFLPRRPGRAQLAAIGKAGVSYRVARRTIREFQPDVVLGGGGYVLVPVAPAARRAKVPLVATEADRHLGLANRIGMRWADRLCTAFPVDRWKLRQEVTGRPVDPRFFSTDRTESRKLLGIDEDAKLVTVVGGSGGALNLNRAVSGLWGGDPAPSAGDAPIHIVHVTGRRDHPTFASRTSSERYRIVDFCHDMPSLVAASDLVVSRAGASIFEFAAARTPAVLVPWRGATQDHQRANAEYFAARGAAVVLEDDHNLDNSIDATLAELFGPDGKRRRAGMADAIGRLARPDAAQRIADIVEQYGLARRHHSPNFAMREAHQGESGTHTADYPGKTSRIAKFEGRRIHFVGAGGAGVSALAQLAAGAGAVVTGCDRASSSYLERLAAAGIDVHARHDPAHISEVRPDLVVASSAIPPDHPELVAAREAGLEVVLRGEFLGQLTRSYRSIVVAGAHGKSTTTAMVWHILDSAGIDASCALGAEYARLDGNAHVGSSNWMVSEGDESDRTLRFLAADVAAITNIERDHHHTFASDEEVEELFADWAAGLSADSTVVLGPGTALDRVARCAAGTVIRFGQDEAALDALTAHLELPGRHNVLNAAAAVEVCGAVGVDKDEAAAALASFTGIGRRFETVANVAGIRVVDDYAHHPTEVAATLAAARGLAGARRTLCVFQPHLFSRTRELYAQFASALEAADIAWVTPIYPAREQPIPGVSEALIIDAGPQLRRLEGDPAEPAAAQQMAHVVAAEVREGDVVITMGAGSITALAPVIGETLSGPVPSS